MLRNLGIVIVFIHFGTFLSGQTFNPEYSEIVNKSSYDTLLANLQTFENSGVKELGSFALERTKNWLISKHSAYGYTDIAEDVFTYSGLETANVVVTKPGFAFPDTYIIIDGHYDTRDGPGADDNGSGTVALLEIARLLKDVPTAYSIKFIHFSVEEIGLIGSWHYVENVVLQENLDIKLVFNLDGIGGVNGMENNRVVCERDESSPPSSNNAASAEVTDQLVTCVELYSDLIPEISYAFASDYIPFEIHGKVITGLYEKNINPNYHSPNDVIANMDVQYLHEVSKAAIGAALHFSGALDSTTRVREQGSATAILLYPNPASDELSVRLGDIRTGIVARLRNTLGHEVLTRHMESGDHFTIPVEPLPAGLYFLEIDFHGGESSVTKVVLQ